MIFVKDGIQYNANTNKNLYSAKFVDKTRQRRWDRSRMHRAYNACEARLWLDSQHDNLPKGIRTIKMCKLYSNDALVTANGLASIVKENV